MKDIGSNFCLDFGSGLATVNVGYKHPTVVKAIKEQADKCDVRGKGLMIDVELVRPRCFY